MAEYSYNAFGQRASKKVHDKTTLFIYDFDGNIIAESTIGESSSAREYFYMGANRLAMSDVYNSRTYFYHNDHLGTPLYMTDPKSDGLTVWEAAYRPFGDAYIKTSVVQNNFRFPGQYYDSETGLHYNYHRYYDPKTGRYMTPDPIGLAGGINPFAYCGNDPVNGMDPWGLMSQAQRQVVVDSWRNAGAAIGAVVGFLGGGGAGMLTGPAAVAVSPVAALEGAAQGAAIGGAAGIGIGVYIAKKNGDGDSCDSNNTRGMTDEELADFLGEGDDWHYDGKAKDDYRKGFRKQLRGDTNADFQIDKDTREVVLRGNKNKDIYVRTGQYYKPR